MKKLEVVIHLAQAATCAAAPFLMEPVTAALALSALSVAAALNATRR